VLVSAGLELIFRGTWEGTEPGGLTHTVGGIFNTMGCQAQHVTGGVGPRDGLGTGFPGVEKLHCASLVLYTLLLVILLLFFPLRLLSY